MCFIWINAVVISKAFNKQLKIDIPNCKLSEHSSDWLNSICTSLLRTRSWTWTQKLRSILLQIYNVLSMGLSWVRNVDNQIYKCSRRKMTFDLFNEPFFTSLHTKVLKYDFHLPALLLWKLLFRSHHLCLFCKYMTMKCSASIPKHLQEAFLEMYVGFYWFKT